MCELSPSHLLWASSWQPIITTKQFSLQVYLWFINFLKVEWGSEPSAVGVLSCGSSSQFRFWETNTHSTFKTRLQTSCFLFVFVFWSSLIPSFLFILQTSENYIYNNCPQTKNPTHNIPLNVNLTKMASQQGIKGWTTKVSIQGVQNY